MPIQCYKCLLLFKNEKRFLLLVFGSTVTSAKIQPNKMLRNCQNNETPPGLRGAFSFYHVAPLAGNMMFMMDLLSALACRLSVPVTFSLMFCHVFRFLVHFCHVFSPVTLSFTHVTCFCSTAARHH